MSAASIWATAACVLGVLLSVALGAYHDLAQRYRGRGVTIAQQRETIRTLRHIGCTSNVVPLRESEAAGRIADVLARNEAARADWTEPEGWQR